MQLKGRGADADDLKVIPAEQGDDGLGKNEGDRAQHQQHDGSHTDAVGIRLTDAAVFARAVAEAAHRLEALSKADDRRIDEHQIPADDGHGGNGRVAPCTGGGV